MKTFKVLLALITRDNDYQREQAAVAEATASRLGISLRIVFADGDAIAQTKQILSATQAPADERPDAIVVEPVGTGMLGVASTAAANGVGWIVLNRESDYLAQLRQGSAVPIGSVECDNVEVGRIQGAQFEALLPAGGSALYIEGPGTDVVKQRRAGLDAALPPSIKLQTLRGKWTEDSAYQMVAARLKLEGTRPPTIALVGCQNDAMAMGARKAVEAFAGPEVRERWLNLPFTGVDGVPTTGQVWVQKRYLAATIVTPALTGVALELLATALGSRSQVPERTIIKPVSYPSLDELRQRANRG
jgi:ribose transport system substrate-binding protein